MDNIYEYESFHIWMRFRRVKNVAVTMYVFEGFIQNLPVVYHITTLMNLF